MALLSSSPGLISPISRYGSPAIVPGFFMDCDQLILGNIARQNYTTDAQLFMG